MPRRKTSHTLRIVNDEASLRAVDPEFLLAASVLRQALADLGHPESAIRADARAFLAEGGGWRFWVEVTGADAQQFWQALRQQGGGHAPP